MKPKNNMPPVHPGEILNEDLEDMGLTPETFAEKLGVPLAHMKAILSSERNIDAEFALRLERYFGSGSHVWLGIQTDYLLKVAERDLGERIKREVEPRVEESVDVVEAA